MLKHCSRAHQAAWRQASEGEICDIEYHARTQSGEWRWLHSRETAFARDTAGQVTDSGYRERHH